MGKTIQQVAQIILGILMIIFGLNKFIGFIPVEPPSGATAQMFLGNMFSSYLYVVVAIFEIVGGALLFVSKTRFLGWLLLSPIIFNIVVFHFSHDFIGNGIWLLPAILFLVIGYFHRERLTSIIQ